MMSNKEDLARHGKLPEPEDKYLPLVWIFIIVATYFVFGDGILQCCAEMLK